MLFQEMLFDTKNEIDDDYCAINETDSKVLEIIFEGTKSGRCDFIGHVESSCGLTCN